MLEIALQLAKLLILDVRDCLGDDLLLLRTEVPLSWTGPAVLVVVGREEGASLEELRVREDAVSESSAVAVHKALGTDDCQRFERDVDVE